MKKALLIAALAVAASPIAVAQADAAKVIVNGQDMTADTASSGQITCGFGAGSYMIQLGGQNGTVMVRLSYPDQAKVVFVNVKKTVPAMPDQLWSTQQGQPQTGSATVTKTGNNYKVTGTIAPYTGSTSGTTVPFEIDATCP